ncbi:hypothetical protein [Candidatus Phytoplasma pruni]|uniref:Uncharacterized protein n=1 Tax=Candidatus Phytoplasma pruni TaxID=479893 RepID=A0A851HCJ6_9MOLU|nr:hypothetical protein [Candidatus Phytoplasma pruni]NWN45708.1 hypothetical protein [Candidatus Phytoplasma pruni]
MENQKTSYLLVATYAFFKFLKIFFIIITSLFIALYYLYKTSYTLTFKRLKNGRFMKALKSLEQQSQARKNHV